MSLYNKRKTVSELLKFVLKLACIFIIFFLLTHFVFGIHRFSDNNMFPNVKDGDLVITYKLEKPSFNDVITYKDASGKLSCARVIGMPNETVSIENNRVFINGAAISETIPYDTPEGKMNRSVTVQENELFILNDYRVNIQDSRTYGPIEQKDMDGVVIFILRRRNF